MVDWLLSLNSAVAIYCALFFMLMGGAIGLPIPEDIPLVIAGVAIHQGQGSVDPGIVVLVCYAGVVVGDIIVFSIGWFFGTALFERRWFRARFPPKRMTSVKSSLERRSLLMIFLARHLFYLRTATFLTCGAVKMSPVRFIISDAIAAMVSVPLMVYIGFKGAEQIDRAMQLINAAKHWSLIIIIVLLAIYLLVRWKRSSVAQNGSAELPK